jgi:hypothetical protein
MALQITISTMSSDLTNERGYKDMEGWHVTTHPGRTFDRNQAITAMTLAEIEGQGLADDPRYAAHVAQWRNELR